MDETNVAEGLGKVAQELSRAGVHHLGIEAQMVGMFQKLLEQVEGFPLLATEPERSDEPEGEQG